MCSSNGVVQRNNIQEMELVKGSAHALVYETGLLIGHTHILFYFIFQLLVQKHKISTIKGVSFTCGLVWLNWIILHILERSRVVLTYSHRRSENVL